MRAFSLHVARAEGPGAGRFVAAALADVLGAGNLLLDIQASPEQPDVGDHGLDFVFSGEPDDHEEVIRVGLDRHDNVVSAELLRRPRSLRCIRAGTPRGLLAALQSGNAVAELRWDQDDLSTLLVTMRRDRQFRVALDPDAE